MGLKPRRHGPDDPDLPRILDLVQTAFAAMEGRVDPPSSVRQLDLASLIRHAETGEVWSVGEPPHACVFYTLRQSSLYVGKLSTAATARRQGLARLLLDHASERARFHKLPVIELDCRIELTENHAAFAAMGFREVARTAHPGFDRPTSITFQRSVD